MRISSPNSHTSSLVVLATDGKYESKNNDKDDGRYHRPLKEKSAQADGTGKLGDTTYRPISCQSHLTYHPYRRC